MLLYLYIYILLLMFPYRVVSPRRYTHKGFSVFFFRTPLFPRNRLCPPDRAQASKFIWRYYSNAFGATGFSGKKLKKHESAYSPGGSKILNEPHLQQELPYVTKNNGFSLSFSYRTTFVTRLRRYCLFCPGAPKGLICDFHDL